jgi:hypothetical protein
MLRLLTFQYAGEDFVFADQSESDQPSDVARIETKSPADRCWPKSLFEFSFHEHSICHEYQPDIATFRNLYNCAAGILRVGNTRVPVSVPFGVC